MPDNFINDLDWGYYLARTIREKPAEFQAVLDKLDTAEKKKLLLTPLSEERRESSLTHIIADRVSGNNDWRPEILAVALDEIEKLDMTAAARVALLTSANELGQTVFHKALKNKQIFDMLEQRLHSWSGDEYADKFMKNFFAEPLGTIDEKVSKTLHSLVGNLLPYGSEDRERINGLCTNPFQPTNYGWPANYYPATYKGLKATVDKARALIKWWAEVRYLDEAANPKLPLVRKAGEIMRDFANNPDCVIKGEPPKRPDIPPPQNKPAAPKPPSGPKA